MDLLLLLPLLFAADSNPQSTVIPESCHFTQEQKDILMPHLVRGEYSVKCNNGSLTIKMAQV